MNELHTLNDQDLDAFLKAHPSVLLVFSNGDDLRNDFSIALKQALSKYPGIAFAQIKPQQNPIATTRFNIGSKSVLVALYEDQEVVRRSRPWGTDVPLAVEMLQNAAQAAQPQPELSHEASGTPNEDPLQTLTQKENIFIVDNKPVNVTDSNFQEEVIDYHLPVLVDFWAEWCGPCRMVAPILDKLAAEFAGQIRIAKVDVDANPGLSQAFRVMSIPTLMMVKERTIVFSQPGALPEPTLRDLVSQLIALEVPKEGESAQEDAEPIDETR